MSTKSVSSKQPNKLCYCDISNCGQFGPGYYRVNYDEANWRLISDQLHKDHRVISVLSRAQLLDDSLNIARTGSLPYSIPFELSSYLRTERDFTPWSSALTAFNYLDKILYHTATKDKLRVRLFF